MPSKQDDTEQAKIEKEYAETGQVPEGWVLDAVGESKGGPKFRKADAETEAAPVDDEAQ